MRTRSPVQSPCKGYQEQTKTAPRHPPPAEKAEEAKMPNKFQRDISLAIPLRKRKALARVHRKRSFLTVIKDFITRRRMRAVT